MKHFEYLDHTGDIAIRAYGDNVEAAFAAAAGAMFEIITGCNTISTRQTIILEVESIDLEGLLVGFLSDLIVKYEVDGLVFGDFDVTLSEPNCLRATARGERYDTKRHGHGTQIKGVSYHMMEIVDRQGFAQSSVTVVFDV